MESGRTYTAALVGFVLGFVASNLLVVASMENARLRAQVGLLYEQVLALRGNEDAREARIQEIIMSVDEQLADQS